MPRWLPHGERCTNAPHEPFAAIVVGLDAGRATFRRLCLGGRPAPLRRLVGRGRRRAQRPTRPLSRRSRHLPGCLTEVQLQPVVGDRHPDVRPATGGRHLGRGGGRSGAWLHSKGAAVLRDHTGGALGPWAGGGRLARELHCTADHLSRLFRNECGIALNAFIREERLHHAQALLVDPSLKVSEVAWACGFRSSNYFIRRFRSARGATPGQARH